MLLAILTYTSWFEVKKKKEFKERELWFWWRLRERDNETSLIIIKNLKGIEETMLHQNKNIINMQQYLHVLKSYLMDWTRLGTVLTIFD